MFLYVFISMHTLYYFILTYILTYKYIYIISESWFKCEGTPRDEAAARAALRHGEAARHRRQARTSGATSAEALSYGY